MKDYFRQFSPLPPPHRSTCYYVVPEDPLILYNSFWQSLKGNSWDAIAALAEIWVQLVISIPTTANAHGNRPTTQISHLNMAGVVCSNVVPKLFCRISYTKEQGTTFTCWLHRVQPVQCNQPAVWFCSPHRLIGISLELHRPLPASAGAWFQKGPAPRHWIS